MTSRYTTSAPRFIGPRVDPVTGVPAFPLPYMGRSTAIREGDTLATLHHPDGRREVVHPLELARRDLECRVRAAGMQ